MTATEVWLRLVDPEVPRDPFRALDLVIEVGADGRGCEREEALRLLHEAAAEWLNKKKIEEFGYDISPQNPTSQTGKVIIAVRRGDWDAVRIYVNWANENPGDNWSRLGVHAELALTVLRELTALHEALA